MATGNKVVTLGHYTATTPVGKAFDSDFAMVFTLRNGKVIEFNSEKLRKLRDEICREHGFEPLSHQFHIYGISPQGREKARAKK